MPGTLQTQIDTSLLELQAKLDEGCERLTVDSPLHHPIFPQQDPSVPHYLPVNLHKVVKSTKQALRIDTQKPSDLDPAYVVDPLKATPEQLIVVRSNDPVVAFHFLLVSFAVTALSRHHCIVIFPFFAGSFYNFGLGQTFTFISTRNS